jgi:EAL domain-containing protein (putative c-di-GMP-specific phosphodiesterase class I)
MNAVNPSQQPATPGGQQRWYLEGYFNGIQVLNRVAVINFPFTVGRQESLALSLLSGDVSRNHAEIVEKDGAIVVRDLGSTNGTFVNRKRIEKEQRLEHGDVVHFGNIEARVVREKENTSTARLRAMTIVNAQTLPENLPTGLSELQHLLEQRIVTTLFQPIISTHYKTTYGFEMLGRGKHPGLSENPYPLFKLAESFHLAIELSELFRDVGIELAASMGTHHKFFMNTHPEELNDTRRLLRSLESLRHSYPDVPLVLEIHEQAVSDIKTVKGLYKEISNLNIGIAYDDFGAGQARLLELVEAPPSYIKFDMNLIRDIDTGAENRREMVGMLVDMAKKMGSKTIAEGVSSEGEARVCH